MYNKIYIIFEIFKLPSQAAFLVPPPYPNFYHRKKSLSNSSYIFANFHNSDSFSSFEGRVGLWEYPPVYIMDVEDVEDVVSAIAPIFLIVFSLKTFCFPDGNIVNVVAML